MQLSSALSRANVAAVIVAAHGMEDEIELGQFASNLNAVEAELNNTERGIDRLLDRHDVITHFAGKGKDVMKMAAIELACDLSDMGMSEEESLQATAGLESESVETVGNEAWATITKAVKDMIEWAGKKLNEAIEWATKLFNKYFGAFETMKKSWEKVLKRAEDKTDQVIDKDNKDAEYTRSAEFYHVGTALKSAEQIADFGPKLTTYVQNTIKLMSEEQVKEVEQTDVLDSEGKRLGLDDLRKNFERKNVSQAGLDFKAIGDNESFSQASESLPGQVKFFSNNVGEKKGKTGDEGYTEFLSNIKTAKVSILPEDPKAKSKDKAKVAFIPASKVVEIATQQIELLDNLIDLMRGPAMKKADKALKDLSKSIKGWNKDVPADDAELEVKNDYKFAVKVATAWVGYERRRFLSQPAALASYIRQYSGALATVCKDSLAAHVKA